MPKSQLTKEITQHNEEIEKVKNEEDGVQLEGNTGELAPISEIQTNYLIVKQLTLEGYLSGEDALMINDKIKNKNMDFEGLINFLKGSKSIEVSEALPPGLDMVAENFHTYEPKDAVNIIVALSKLNKGFKGLRTTKPKNWFPATYLLFGMVGIMVLLQYLGSNGAGDLGSIFEGFNFGSP